MNKSITELSTPALIIDMDIVERNLHRAAEVAQSSGKKLRPHIKTHKIPELAAMQMVCGAVGISAAKLSEAEVMADNGITDILLANQIVGSDKLKRLVDLAKRTTLTVLCDSHQGVQMLAQAAQDAEIVLKVMVEVETGDLRCGTAPNEVLSLVQYIMRHPQLRFAGLETFGGSVYHSADAVDMKARAGFIAGCLLQLKEELEQQGIAVDEVSVGGSPSFNLLAGIDGITELRPGVYIFNDVASVYRGAVNFCDCAATVLTTVISKPACNRMVIDGGAKTFSYCCPGSVFGKKIHYGVVLGNEVVALTKLSEEHGVIEAETGLQDYRVGDKLQIIPTHACPVINLFDSAYFCRKGSVVEQVSIAARGKTQ